MSLNVGKSVRVLLAKRDKHCPWLAENLGVSDTRARSIASIASSSTATVKKLADVFGIKASEFIAEGED